MNGASGRQMTSRERVRATVAGQPVDRVPIMTWLNPHAGCRLISEFRPASDPEGDAKGRSLWQGFLDEASDLPDDVRCFMPLLHSGFVNREYALDLGSDLVDVGIPIADLGRAVSGAGEPLRILDAFGSVRAMGSVFLDVVEPAVAKIEDLVALELPDLSSDRPFAAIRRFREQHPDACLYGDSFGVQDLPSTQLWDMSQFMLALYDYPDEIKAFQARLNDYMMGMSRRLVEAGADVVLILDDYGTTGAPLTSVEMWKEFTYPHLARHIEAVHDAGGLAMLHSCGYQMPFLPHYVEAGLDILQTFQPKAGNDFRAAYDEYGDRLTFACGIDVQQGELMKPEELRDDILGAYAIGGRNGRHILGYSHMLQYTMPAENVEVILRTTREIQQGLHD